MIAHFEPLPALATLGERWRALEPDADGSFFLSWCWIGSWLEASGARPDLLAVRSNGRDVALGLFGMGRDKRPFGTVPMLCLNQAGDADADRPYIEYNGLLALRTRAGAAHVAAMEALAARTDWRVLRLSGVEPDSPLPTMSGMRRRIVRDTSPAYFIDLDAVRAGSDYLALLSTNTRSQIRRSFKDHGAPAVARADTPDVIDLWLEDMARLNVGRHADNAWDHAGFRRFAALIARNGLADGSVELLRITCGGALTGYLLNFLWRGRAMNYQSAFVEPAGPKSKPGLMCHAAAVDLYADAGCSTYSLLAGKDRYKQSLSTGAESLVWWSLERFSPALEVEALARAVRARLQPSPAPAATED